LTIKKLVYDILLVSQECRNSDKKLIWEVLDKLGFITYTTECMEGELKHYNFKDCPTFEGIRRCRQALQRSDLLTGAKLIQPSEVIKKERVRQSKEKGYNYIQGKAIFNPVSQCYEIS
jgi:hypothetical protein